MKWAFVDYENIGNLDKIDLSVYEKIIILLGAKQQKLDFGEKKYDKILNTVIIQMKVVQENNLDFHLSYYLGMYNSIAEEKIAFDIISNDNGYSPLISHIKANGRFCKQVKVESSSQTLTKLIASLTSKPTEKRPQKLSGLKNHIASHLGIKDNEMAIQNHLNNLVRAKVISIVDESSFTYLA